MSNTVTVQYEEKVAKITLNRPDKMNSMNQEMLEEMATKMEEVSQSEAQIVILTGEGRAFSAGGDINMMLIMTILVTSKRLWTPLRKQLKPFIACRKSLSRC